MKKEVAIVIPIYKQELSCLEKVSLEQARRIFLKYDMFFVCPDSLEMFCDDEKIQMIRLDAKWFTEPSVSWS